MHIQHCVHLEYLADVCIEIITRLAAVLNAMSTCNAFIDKCITTNDICSPAIIVTVGMEVQYIAELQVLYHLRLFRVGLIWNTVQLSLNLPLPKILVWSYQNLQ
jgi:hypothetical protein